MSFKDWLQHGWNAFMNKDPTPTYSSPSFSVRPDRPYYSYSNDKNIVSTVRTKIGVDCMLCDLQHVQLDENGRYLEPINSFLNECLTYSANIDQTGRAMLLDAVISLLDEGVIAIVPVELDENIDEETQRMDERDYMPIYQIRVGKIVQWYPDRVMVNLYNQETGYNQDVILPKDRVAIVENPFYAIMNAPNSTGKRLARKIALLDAIDDRNGAGKIDMIIQVPYTIKNSTQRDHAMQTLKDIEMQLSNSKFGIAYVDSTEHITQLNRSVDNQLLKQIEDLRKEYLDELGMTPEILNGTADEKVMSNYTSRVCEPILLAIVEEMNRKFLNPVARATKQAIRFFRDPFKLIPVAELAELIDKLTRNAVVTANECRQFMGMKPSKDPNADVLKNANMPEPEGGYGRNKPEENETSEPV